ncbi:MAG: hypothetical protein AB1941_08955 [Gemmatimonadota bacterium]
MKKWYGLLAASVLCIGVASCGDSSLVAPETPRFDGGSTIGTGYRTGSTFTVTAATDTTHTPSATAERGGHTAGSGN